jgi:hypothetical protein
MNPIMIDGTGMCGGCRVSVAGATKFACVDGPEFDAHQVDFRELADRQMKSPDGGKALLIENPTVNGQPSPFPVAINTMGSHKRMAMSLGASSVDEIASELGALMKTRPPTGSRKPSSWRARRFQGTQRSWQV